MDVRPARGEPAGTAVGARAAPAGAGRAAVASGASAGYPGAPGEARDDLSAGASS